MRSSRGQGTVEYLTVVLLVAVVLGGGATAAAATGAGADIASAVPHQIMRALCIVTGGDCERDRAPCAVASSTAASAWSANVWVLSVGHGRVLVIDRRSDGKVLVTLTTTPSGGVRTTNGAVVRIERGRRRLALGGAVTASAIAALGHGKTWVLPDAATATAFVAALGRGDDVRRPDQETRSGQLDIAVSAARGGVAADAAATGTIHATGGVRTDHLTGAKTYYLEVGADAVLDLAAALGTVPLGASGRAAGSAQLALTVDRDGRWVDLTLTASGDLSASTRLPGDAGSLAESLDVPTAAGRRWIAEAHLDLNDPENLAAAQAVVERVRAVPPSPRADAAAVATLANRIADGAVVDLRAYALDRTRSGFSLDLGTGLAVGGGHETSTEHTRLIAARTRGLDGIWRRRDDCLKEARA
jgi:hypothetical protein